MGACGFGSCHSLGDAVGLSGYVMCQMRGAIRRRIFLKMRRVGYAFVQYYLFFQVQIVPKPFTCQRGKSLLVACPISMINTWLYDNLSGGCLPCFGL